MWDGIIYPFLNFNCAVMVNSSPHGQSGHHLTDDILKGIFMNEKFCILIKISLKFVPKDLIYNKLALVPVMAYPRLSNRTVLSMIFYGIYSRYNKMLPNGQLKGCLLWMLDIKSLRSNENSFYMNISYHRASSTKSQAEGYSYFCLLCLASSCLDSIFPLHHQTINLEIPFPTTFSWRIILYPLHMNFG